MSVNGADTDCTSFAIQQHVYILVHLCFFNTFLCVFFFFSESTMDLGFIPINFELAAMDSATTVADDAEQSATAPVLEPCGCS